MAKTHNDPDNRSTTSDTSTGLNRMKMRSQDEEDFDGSIGDTEQETDTIKYFCSKCVYTCVDVDFFVRHWSDIYKKNVFVCRVHPCCRAMKTNGMVFCNTRLHVGLFQRRYNGTYMQARGH